MSSGNWDWVGGVLEDARALRDMLPVCCLKELQVGARDRAARLVTVVEVAVWRCACSES